MDKLVEIFKTLFRECDKCEEIVGCGYLLWFGKEAITLDPGIFIDNELEQIIKNKCKRFLSEYIEKYSHAPSDSCVNTE